MFKFDNVTCLYKPFPAGIIENVIDKDIYNELVDTFPDVDNTFSYDSGYGIKYRISDTVHKKKYSNFMLHNSTYKELDAYIKSDKFVNDIFDMLESFNINVEYRNYSINPSPVKRVLDYLIKRKLRLKTTS